MSRAMLALCLISLLPVWLLNEVAPNDLEEIVFTTKNRDGPYYEVDSETEADLVLVVDFAGSGQEHQATFNLKKNRRSKQNWFGSYIGRGFAACGAGDDDKGVGFSGSESLNIVHDDIFEVSLSYSWWSSRVNGSFEDKISLPWRDEARLDKHGITVHAYFREAQINQSDRNE